MHPLFGAGSRSRSFARTLALLAVVALLASLFPAMVSAAPRAERQAVIVVFDDSVANPSAAAGQLGRQYGFAPTRVYQHALKGFAATIPSRAVAGLSADPRVAFVEADQVAHIAAQTTPTGINRIFAPGNGEIDIDGNDDFRVDVDVAIIDTGIDLDHPDLNVVASTNCSGGSPFKQSCSGTGDDDNGHGTHVGGTVAALDNDFGVVGVAPGARLWGVKVLRADGSGYISWIVAGIDWVTARADQIEVANMSLGCACSSSAMDTAIANSVNAGVAYAVAAGNSDSSSSGFSPANHPDVLTVSALADFDGLAGGLGAPTCRDDQDDTLADFSNWGSTIEIAAPGVCILSSVPGGGYDTFSGTSMASPHAAGALALVASGGGDPTNKTQVNALYKKLTDNGNFNWTDDSGDGRHEPLLDVSDDSVFNPVLVSGSGGGGGGGTAPTADFSADKTSGEAPLTVAFTDLSTGDPTSWAWDFQNDGTVDDINQNPSFTYAAAGSYTVKLVVSNASGTDDEVKTSFISVTSSEGISLAATPYKVRGLQKVDLEWSGATSTNVDVRRDGGVIATTANGGSYTDNIDQRGGGSYTYQICEAGTSTCSNTVTVTF